MKNHTLTFKAILFAVILLVLLSTTIPTIIGLKTTENSYSKTTPLSYTPLGETDGENFVSTINILPADFIVLGTDDTFFDYLIPGKYSHTVLYCGKVQPGEDIWDRDNHEWMPAGTPYVIHSTKGDDAGNGLGYSTWDVAINHHADNALVLRVLKPDGTQLTFPERKAVVDFAKSKLDGGIDGYPIGPQYDWNWFFQQIDVDSEFPAPAGYYCSELVWASYLGSLGIDLDANTSPFDIGVSPDDIWHSQYSSVIAGETGDVTFNATKEIAKLSLYVDNIYYTDDYDPWPKGEGEMYILSRSGLGIFDDDGNILSTEQGYPGCGKIGNTPDGTWGLDGEGTLYWNTNFYSLLSVHQTLRVQIEAWEEDDDSEDDSYPRLEWTWAAENWQQFRDNGWHNYQSNLDDCTYTFSYKLDTLHPPYLCGDSNCDGIIDVGDAVYLISYIFRGGPPPFPQVCAGDVNNDGITNVGDAVYLISYIFRDGPPPQNTCC